MHLILGERVRAPKLKFHPEIIDVNVISVRFYVIRPHFVPEHSGTSLLGMCLSCMRAMLSENTIKIPDCATFKDSHFMELIRTQRNRFMREFNDIECCRSKPNVIVVRSLQFAIAPYLPPSSPFLLTSFLLFNHSFGFSMYTCSSSSSSNPVLNDTIEMNVDRM